MPDLTVKVSGPGYSRDSSLILNARKILEGINGNVDIDYRETNDRPLGENIWVATCHPAAGATGYDVIIEFPLFVDITNGPDAKEQADKYLADLINETFDEKNIVDGPATVKMIGVFDDNSYITIQQGGG